MPCRLLPSDNTIMDHGMDAVAVSPVYWTRLLPSVSIKISFPKSVRVLSFDTQVLRSMPPFAEDRNGGVQSVIWRIRACKGCLQPPAMPCRLGQVTRRNAKNPFCGTPLLKNGSDFLSILFRSKAKGGDVPLPSLALRGCAKCVATCVAARSIVKQFLRGPLEACDRQNIKMIDLIGARRCWRKAPAVRLNQSRLLQIN